MSTDDMKFVVGQMVTLRGEGYRARPVLSRSMTDWGNGCVQAMYGLRDDARGTIAAYYDHELEAAKEVK